MKNLNSKSSFYCETMLTTTSLDHAVDNDAKTAKGHELLTGIIRGGCRAAIWISERV